MTEFCIECGEPLDAIGVCANGHGGEIVESSSMDLTGVLPKAPLSRRLAGDGLEVTVLVVLEIVGTILGYVTFGITGILSSVIGMTYMACKDLNHGSYSLGKLIAHTRVVDQATGELASNKQAFIRNSYYVFGWLLACLPFVGFIGQILVFLALIVDVLMVLAHPRGLRLGDFLAGTQVVPIEED